MAEVTTPAAVDVDARTKALFESLWNDKELGAKVRAKAKAMYPDVTLPEDSFEPIINPMREQLDAMRAELEADRKALADEKAETAAARQKASLEDAINGARTKYSLTDEGFDKMVARMKETANYTDADAAAAWVAQQTPPVTAKRADWLPRKANFLGSAELNENEDFKLLHTNPDRYLDSQLERFVNDPDAYVAETFGRAA
jgi:Skp family chaperone for outer membrane proteins